MSTATTTTERLIEAKTARHSLAVGLLSSYTVNGNTYTKHTIGALSAYISVLEQELADESTTQGHGFIGMQIEGLT